MISSRVTMTGMCLLVLVALFLPAGSSSAVDIAVFIDIPVVDPYQAAVEPLLACRNGFMFGFHALDRSGLHKDGLRPWNISLFTDDGTLLIEEYPLWLAKAETPLVRNGNTFPYNGYYTLLWSENIPATPVTTCYGGAGDGFCKNRLEIEDCTINPAIVADFAQIGHQDTTRVVTDTLVYEVRAYDPDVGTRNGDGIEQIRMDVIDPGAGAVVYSATRARTFLSGKGIVYCALAKNCAAWSFAEHDEAWPNGEPVKSGTYLLRATAGTADNERTVVQTQITIDVPAKQLKQTPVQP